MFTHPFLNPFSRSLVRRGRDGLDPRHGPSVRPSIIVRTLVSLFLPRQLPSTQRKELPFRWNPSLCRLPVVRLSHSDSLSMGLECHDCVGLVFRVTSVSCSIDQPRPVERSPSLSLFSVHLYLSTHLLFVLFPNISSCPSPRHVNVYPSVSRIRFPKSDYDYFFLH